MTVGRRPPPPAPTGQPPSLPMVWKLLLQLWRYVIAGYDGLPANHSHVGGEVVPPTEGGGSERMYSTFIMGG